jgi:hypothetical protein
MNANQKQELNQKQTPEKDQKASTKYQEPNTGCYLPAASS